MMRDIVVLFFIFLTVEGIAQLQVDQPIELNGGTGQRSVLNLEAPVNGTDAVNKDYVDSAVSASGGSSLSMITDESVSTMNLGDAIRYCNALIDGGHTDWRLPAYSEIIPLISSGGVTVPSNASSNPFWFAPELLNWTSGTNWAGGAIRLSDGVISPIAYNTTNLFKVRCVR